ncbi:dTDP-4-dehydrorhamnose reductase [Flagellimonas lutaonensis]|uniref:dTDP-4-dehydrorhamnose reductase n=1 Tax=Flagellimonas lutaonensis TaxID=516051 RepID=A0A0D5YT01_9FLAO|nr:dTDP-4-dehydrorhamnose reductase [Allomuricauda lutaonensis]AKA34986.1 dTDP-4-dehydrorhamnose reductase [Allomuricauda lutaonensis]
MKRILVTGAGGQLGLTLQELAPNYPELSFDFKTSEELDITKKAMLGKTISDDQYHYCINCAAFTNVEDAEKNPPQAFEVNAEGVKNLAETCKKNKVVLIHISTDYVFDGEKDSPYLPGDKPNPINEYGRSKLQGERYVQKILDHFYIVRTSWLYSKKHGKNFYRTILEKAKKGETLKVTDTQIGCPTNTISLTKFLFEELIKKEPPFGIYHFTDGEAISWYEFAKRILKEQRLVNSCIKAGRIRANVLRPKNSILGQR